LENVRLLRALTERAGQLEGINEIATAMASTLQSDQLVASLLDQLRLVLPYDTATLWLRHGDGLAVAAARGFPDAEERLGVSVRVMESALFKEIVTEAQPLSIGDVRQDARFPAVDVPRLSWLGIPLVVKGEVTGLIALEKSQAAFYDREQVQLAATLASQAAVALENASLYEESLRRAAELDERSKRLAVLNRFSSALSGLLDSDQVLTLATDEIQRAVGASQVAAVSFDTPRPTWVAASPGPAQPLPQLLPDAPIFGRLRESLGVFATQDARSEADLAPLEEFVGREAKGLLILPLAAGQELLAMLFVHNAGPGGFASTEIELARTISNQTAIALQNARLYQSTVRAAERLSVLNQASAEVGTSLEPEDIYLSIQRSAALLMPVDAFVITLLEADGDQVQAVYLMDHQHRLPGTQAALGKGLGSRVILSGEPLLLNSAAEITELDGRSLPDGSAARSGVAVPLILGSRAIGMLSARSHKPDAYTAEDLRILGTLANQAAVTIQNGRLFAETQPLARELEQRVVERTAQLNDEQQNTETLLRILTEVSASLDLDRALNRTLSLLSDAVRAEQGTIMLLTEEDGLLHYRAGYGHGSARSRAADQALRLKVGQGLPGWVVQNREAALVDDVRKDSRWAVTSAASRKHRSAIASPLLVGDDVIGVLMVVSSREGYFTEDSLALVKAIGSQVAVAINNARLYELIRDQAERLGVMLRKEQEEASRSQAILESVADGVLVTGADNRISFANASVTRILGAKAAKLVGQPVERLGVLFGDPGRGWLAAVERWAEAPVDFEAGDTYAERLELGDGRIALVHLAPVVLGQDFLGTVSILRDITHEVEVDRLKSEFVATVSHELRTPMTAIKGYVEMLVKGAAGAVNDNQSHFLDIVAKNIDRLESLVDDLLDVSRIESGNVDLVPQELDLAKVAADVIAEMQKASEEDKKPTTFSIKASRNVPSVLGDPERIRQVLHTLLDNAYHYTPENGVVQVRLRSVSRRSAVQVDVVDNGVGIPKGDQPRIFERFFRGEDPLVLATPGTGLGLSIAKQLVEMHHGTISVTSDGVPGKGSTFTFTLPAFQTTVPGSAPAPRGRRTSAGKRPARSGSARK
jgi:PAS domain S-box-containing protein